MGESDNLEAPQADGQTMLAAAIDHCEGGEITRARAELEQAVVCFRQGGDRANLGDALTILGSLYHARPYHDLARGYYQTAVRCYNEIEDFEQAAAVTGSLGIVEQEAGRYREAEAHYRQARGRCLELESNLLAAILTGQLGTLFHERGRLAEARACYDEVIPALRLAEDQRNCALFLACRGGLAAAEDRLVEARRDHDAAIGAVHVLDDPEAEAVVWLLRGLLDLAESRQATADAESAEALRLRAETRIATLAPELRSSDDVSFALRLVERALGGDPAAASDPPVASLAIASDGRRLQTPTGVVVDLRRRTAMRRLVQRLICERLTNAGGEVPAEHLLEAAWPERSGRRGNKLTRVTAALAELEGLGIAIASGPGGSMIPPEQPVVIAGDYQK